jgi:chromosome segregation ATPase
MDEGFIDLRYGGERDTSSESFWPSFTDIMMVVLMIFMIASTILMMRNWELVRELRTTLEAEREAEALALSATRTSETLEERLANAQHEISELRIQLLRASEERQASSRKLRTLEDDRQGLTARLQKSQNQLKLSSDRLQQKQAEVIRMSDARAALEARLQEMQDLEQAHSSELATLRQQYTDSELLISNLQGSYDELSVKYNKLIKPARSAAGKYVVSVRYRKTGDAYSLEFKEMEQSDYESLNRKQLDKRLSALKSEYPGALYVKVIIPENSGLSYSEAWGFTQDILDRYDYYHQKK